MECLNKIHSSACVAGLLLSDWTDLSETKSAPPHVSLALAHALCDMHGKFIKFGHRKQTK